MRKKNHFSIAIFILILMAFGLRLWLLFLRKHPSSEEVWAVLLSQASAGDIWRATFADLHGPFYFLFIHFLSFVSPLPITIVTVRFISLFFGMIACIGMWHLGILVSGKKVGFICFILSLFLPAFVWPAVFARYYSLLIVLTIISLILFIDYLKQNTTRNLFWLILVLTVGVYTHYYFILLPVSYTAFLLMFKTYRPVLPKMALVFTSVTVLCTPALYYLVTLPKPELIGRHTNSILKIPALVITNIVSSETLIFLYLWEKKYVYIPVLVVLGIVTLFLLFEGYKHWTNSPKLLFVSVLVIPIIITTVFAYTIKPLLSLGSLQIFMPALIVVLAYGIRSDLQKSKVLTFIFGIAVVISMIFLFKTSAIYQSPRKDFAFFINNYKPNELVLHSHLGSYLLATHYVGKENNYEIIRNDSVTPLTAKGVGLRPISLESLAWFQGGIWYFESPYVSASESDTLKSQLTRKRTLVHQEQFWTSTANAQETYFNVYYFK